MASEFDLIVIGHGASAFAATIRASELGIKTAMVGWGSIGGTCVNVGFVPTKYLLSRGEQFYHRERFGPKEGMKIFRKAMKEKEDIVKSLREEKYVSVLRNLSNVTYLN